MEVYCSFTKFPEPIAALAAPTTPFPEISATKLAELAEALELTRDELPKNLQEHFENSYVRIFEPGNGDTELPSDEADEAACYSPKAAAAIAAAAEKIPHSVLKEALSSALQETESDSYRSVDQALGDLADIVETFHEAGKHGYGVILGIG